jgi:DGQHR domain-containing protein
VSKQVSKAGEGKAVGHRKVHETSEHAWLKSVVKEIARTSGFKCDSEVVLNFSESVGPDGRLTNERSIDVAAFGSTDGKGYLIVFETKGGGRVDEAHQKRSAWQADLAKMRAGMGTVIVSDENALDTTELRAATEIRVCYVFGENLPRERFEALSKVFNGGDFYALDSDALAYYRKTAFTIGRAAKYQILREVGINLETSAVLLEQAIAIKQRGIEMYLLGAKPSTLIKVGYVYRRASGRPKAYQRILSKERIAKISEFVKSAEALLPNAIIIVFDDDPKIQKEVYFKDGNLYFPSAYCSAWIIDGQHRVFGFLDSPLGLAEDESAEVFKLPVVAFKNLDLLLQNRTFVSINYNQKKIDPTLLCDLATELPDLKNELTWPSLLVANLNRMDPLRDRVRISELDKGRPITIASFARYGLLEGLLGYDRRTRKLNGALHSYAPFRPRASVTNRANVQALQKQTDLLRRYFTAVAQNTRNSVQDKDPWRNMQRYSLLKPTGINALLLVLSRLMLKYPRLEKDLHKDLGRYLRPLRSIRFTRTFVAKQGGGWKGFRNLANVMLRKLNATNRDSLKLYGGKEKR